MLNGAGVRAYVCAEAVDMRKSIDALSVLVQPVFAADPFSGHWFVFLSRSRNKVKLLYWDGNGFVLVYKRLEKGRFPKPEEWCERGLTAAELTALLAGIDLSRATRATTVRASRVM
jgi:transposase